MKKIIGVIANDDKLKNSIENLFPEEVKEGKIIIETLKTKKEQIELQARRIVKKGAKALISRSGAFEVVEKAVNVPAVRLRITITDILIALNKADYFGKEIVLIQRDHIKFIYEEWKGFINLNNNVIVEKYNQPEEVEPIIKKYNTMNKDVVFVGGGFCCKYASLNNFKSVFINASDESIRETILQAKEILNNLEKEILQRELSNTMLNVAHDAILSVDKKGKITHINERAQSILKVNFENVINEYLNIKLPQLSFILDILDKNVIKIEDQIKMLSQNLIIAVNTSLIIVEDEIYGVLCSFQDITKLQKLEKKIRYQLSKKGLIAKFQFSDIIAQDIKMIKTIEEAKKIGKTDSTVVIYGESGTGKEMFAQSMHNTSNRKDAPFVAINCAAISESILESELFGYEEGAFTGARKGGKPGLFELAHGGTLLLDEINSISLNLQAKLLRVLEEKEVMRLGSDYVIPLDVRIIAASNESLNEKVLEGTFRADLFYRLSVLSLSIPPLRERKDDIIPLFRFFINKINSHVKPPNITKDTANKLIKHFWVGNVRELKNVAQRFVVLGQLKLDESYKNINKSDADNGELIDINENSIDLKVLNQYIEEKIIFMLSKQGYNKSQIAKILGVSRTALWKKMNHK